MLNLKQIITTVLLISISYSIAVNNQDSFLINTNENHLIQFTLQHSTRVSFISYYGMASFKIKVDNSIIYNDNPPFGQIELQQEYLNKDITLEISNGPAIGIIRREVIEKYQILSTEESKMIQLSEKKSRIIELHPRKYTTLTIQKFEGIVTFTNNRCLASQKQDCFYELDRVDPNKMTKYIQTVKLDSCLSCIVLIKVQSLTSKALLRLSINAELYILSNLPVLTLLKKDQQKSFFVYGQPNTQGKILQYTGSCSINSATQNTQFENGYFFQVPKSHNFSKPIEIIVKGLQTYNYLMIEGPNRPNPLELRDGLPETFEIKPNLTYLAKLDKKGEGRGNFVLIGNSSLLRQLYIRFINKELNLHYAVRPQFLFNVGIASQNFQLDNSTGIIQLEIKNLGDKSGFLNASATLSEMMNLPLNWRHSSILELRQYNYYIVDGINDTIEVILQKCVECPIQIGFSTDSQNYSDEQINERIFKRNFTIKEGPLYIRVFTNNYAFYSILVQNSSTLQSKKTLQKLKVETYLTRPEEDLELVFIAPKCGENYCNGTKYYLLEGSNKQHVTSRAYCPNALFDFDQRTKDIVFEQITPTAINQSHFSFIRPLKHRDWLLITAEVDSQIFSYDLINSGQIREYNSIRWPIFYFILFLTFAVFISFVIFMALNRPKGNSMGYIRGASAVSQEQIND